MGKTKQQIIIIETREDADRAHQREVLAANEAVLKGGVQKGARQLRRRHAAGGRLRAHQAEGQVLVRLQKRGSEMNPHFRAMASKPMRRRGGPTPMVKHFLREKDSRLTKARRPR
jgi:hypothetical protein